MLSLTHQPNRALYLLLVIASTVTIFACKSFEGAKVKVTPDPLEVHADSVQFKVKAKVPPKSGIRKGGTYMGQLVIQNQGKSYQMTRVTIPYEKYPDIRKRGASVSVSAKQPYQEGMNGGTLLANNRYVRKGKEHELPKKEMAKCCITTSKLVCEDPKLMLSEHDYTKKVPITLEAKFQFPQDVFEIQPTEYEKAEIEAIGEFLEKQYKTTNITISGFASPEGAFSRNKMLSINRSKQVKKWLTEQLKKNGYEAQFDSSFFKVNTTTEDWEGFKANLDRTNYSEDIKRQIIQIISAGYEEDLKEKKILGLVGGVEEVEFILAPLRRATIVLEGYSSSHSDDEIKAFAQKFANGNKSKDELEQFYKKEELLYAADLVEDNAVKMKLLKEFTRLYPDDARGYNNLGVYAMRDGKTEEALDYLKIADKKSENNAAVMNNMGAAQMMKGNYGGALSNLQTAYSNESTQEVAFNMGVAHQKMASYSMAADMFESAGDLQCAHYNAGLTKLLMNDLAGAKSDLEDAIRKDKNRALNYYAMAIVGARSADKNLMTLNLKRAVQINEDLAIKAQNDLEFRRYFDDPEFKVAATPN
jgi:Tfp pilus assembly protein PilF/outer membrane protein OmpA-like peptidoglycan-associated protein